MKQLQYFRSSNLFWVRFFGLGFLVKYPSSPPLFSERYGYRKPLLSIFGFRVFYLNHSSRGM